MENKATRISFDALLVMAATEANNRDMDLLPSLEEMQESFHPSVEFTQKMEAALKQTRRKDRSVKFRRHAKRVVAAAAIIMSVSFCVMMPVQAVHQAVISTLVEWKNQFSSYIFSSDTHGERAVPQSVTLTYLPEEYDNVPTVVTGQLIYSAEYDAKGKRPLLLMIRSIGATTQHDVDNENTSTRAIRFDGINATWIAYDDGINMLFWNSGGLSYSISCESPIEEIIKIVQGMEH